MSVDELTHVKALVRGLHAPAKNVSRPKQVRSAGRIDDVDSEPIEHHTYAHDFPTRDHHFPQNSFSIPSLVVTGIDNNDHPFGGGAHRRFSNFNFGLRRFSASFMVFCFYLFLFLVFVFVFLFKNSDDFLFFDCR